MGEPIFINANEQVWVSPEYWELVQKEMKAIQRVRELHSKDENDECAECIKDWDIYEDTYIFAKYPCPTIQALDGDQS